MRTDERRVRDDVLGPTGLVDLGAVTDAQLGALAPVPIDEVSWWSARRHPQGCPSADTGGSVPSAQPTGAQLRAVRSVLHAAGVIVTWDDGNGRGAFVVADDVVLVDRIGGGRHHLLLGDLPVATTLLAVGLDPLDRARPAGTGVAAVDVLARDEVRRHLPDEEIRDSTVRLARVCVGPPPSESLVTVVATDDEVIAWRALPGGGAAVSTLDRDGVVAAARALLAPGATWGHR